MDGKQFDSLTRALGAGRSRRSVLKGLGKGLGAAAAGAAGVAAFGSRTEAANGGNSDCAHFCTATFPPGAARGQCVSDAAHGTGICYQCGPAAANTGLALCGQTCVNEQADNNNCGACGNVCTSPANGSSTCSAGGCVVTCNSGYQADGNGGCVAVSSCGACPAFSTPDCYWLSNGDLGTIANCWYPTEVILGEPFDQATCAAINACGNGGGCYEWRTSSC
jgi:hypothetical protein